MRGREDKWLGRNRVRGREDGVRGREDGVRDAMRMRFQAFGSAPGWHRGLREGQLRVQESHFPPRGCTFSRRAFPWLRVLKAPGATRLPPWPCPQAPEMWPWLHAPSVQAVLMRTGKRSHGGKDCELSQVHPTSAAGSVQARVTEGCRGRCLSRAWPRRAVDMGFRRSARLYLPPVPTPTNC